MVKSKIFYDSREWTHSFALILNEEVRKYFYRYKWYGGYARGEYGEKSFSSWAFKDFDNFIGSMVELYDLQDLKFSYSLKEDKQYIFEEFLTIKEVEL